ncbi:hypothetical protein [Agrobacterium radiobacter]|uniref:hypothetical protein n=1 Tax=Agrobacterium radiobacter TaxID=362 RepID=UPI003F856865
MAVLRKAGGVFSVGQNEAAKTRDRFRHFGDDDFELDDTEEPEDFNPMVIAWGKVKPQPLPDPVKRTRKRAA